MVFSCHSFPENVANFVVKFVEKLLHENKLVTYLIHGKKRFSSLNEEISTSPFSFILSFSPPLKSELEEIHFGSITSVVNYFQRIYKQK